MQKRVFVGVKCANGFPTHQKSPQTDNWVNKYSSSKLEIHVLVYVLCLNIINFGGVVFDIEGSDGAPFFSNWCIVLVSKHQCFGAGKRWLIHQTRSLQGFGMWVVLKQWLYPLQQRVKHEHANNAKTRFYGCEVNKWLSNTPKITPN